ncbi:DUF805 domain-containing protein [Macrococcus brunensis]|uniref:DUF805 domain-containing protein n=1 Tax=Macrococcus brunensis TaxID=198483 RepID=UPI001EF0BFE4|nr:DUF805 domain-containing protein [Macrococcus brunensis]ULG73701.1 DUF805 domain-containing protein [Macrococcus brunensis]
MTWMEAYKRFWQNAFKMRGRARRKEYWVPQLFNGLIAIALSIIFSFVDSAMGFSTDFMANDQMTNVSFTKPSDIVNGIWSLIILILGFTVLARRLQDININGWWALLPNVGGIVFGIGLIITLVFLFAMGGAESTPLIILIICGLILIIMAIVFFVFTVMDGKPGPNKYGEDPKKNERYFYNDTYKN